MREQRVFALARRLEKGLRRQLHIGRAEANPWRSTFEHQRPVPRNAYDLHRRRGVRQRGGQGRFELDVGAKTDVDAVIRLRHMRLGVLAVAQQRVHQFAQACSQGYERRLEYETFAHIDDGMRLQRVKTDPRCTIHSGDLEHGPPARAGRHGDELGNLGIANTVFFQCTDDRIALVRAIKRRRKVLQGAAAADTEVNAARVHAFFAARRNSRLPSPPSMGLSMWPSTDQPCTESSQCEMPDSAASCASASRTIPPFPTAKRPTSNCGLTRATSQAPLGASASAGGNASFRPMKLTSATIACGGSGTCSALRSRALTPSRGTTLSSRLSLPASWPCPTSTA